MCCGGNVGIVMTIGWELAIVMFIRILLDLSHWIDLPVIKGFEVSATGLDVVWEVSCCLMVVAHPGWQCVMRMLTRHSSHGTMWNLKHNIKYIPVINYNFGVDSG